MEIPFICIRMIIIMALFLNKYQENFDKSFIQIRKANYHMSIYQRCNSTFQLEITDDILHVNFAMDQYVATAIISTYY